MSVLKLGFVTALIVASATMFKDSFAEEPIAKYLSAVKQVNSYNVLLTATSREMVKTEVQMRDIGGREFPRYVYSLFPSGEVGGETVLFSRQAWEQSGRRRVDVGEAVGDWSALNAFNGEVVTKLDTRSLQGAIEAIAPSQRPFVPSSMSYATLFAEVFLGGTYEELIRSRASVRTELVGDEYRLHIPAEKGKLYPRHSFLITLCPDRGYLPNKIDVRLDGEIQSITYVEDYVNVDGEVTVPVFGYQDLYGVDQSSNPVIFSRTEIRVDVEKSSWNLPLQSDEFRIVFPQGSRIRDDVRGEMFVAGKTSPEANLNELYEKSKTLFAIGKDGKAIPAKTDRLAVSKSWRTSALLLLNIGLLCLIVFHHLKRRLK